MGIQATFNNQAIDMMPNVKAAIATAASFEASQIESYALREIMNFSTALSQMTKEEIRQEEEVILESCKFKEWIKVTSNELKTNTVAKDIKDFDFEAGFASGYGDYTADIKIGNTEFSVDLKYEYGYYGSGERFGCFENNLSNLDNETAIEIAAKKAGIELDDDTVIEIIQDLEGQVETYVEANYSQTIDDLQTGFENHQEELRQERDQDSAYGPWGDSPGM